MCGITGIINHESFSNIKMMVEAQKRRGPDNSSFEIFPSIQSSLGHNRLTIIDVSENANQPFYDFSKTHVIVFNGEVYNYKELKYELEKKGHIFRTHSDTEVVLLSFLEWGEDCVKRFRGMFAFVILNSVNGNAFFARDRFGIKPLLYTLKDKGVLFSSELKAILASSIVDKKIRNEALFEFLINGSIHQPNTFYKGIFQIPAGHYGKFENGEFHVIQYWDIYENTKELKSSLKNISYADAVIELRKHLDEAAKYHMIADVPVGAFLSGGIDSTAVVGLMSKLSSSKINTFTICFENEYSYLDELQYAELASSFLQTQNASHVLNFSEFKNDLSTIIGAMDQPTIDGTNTFYASKLASQSVKVVLSGLGGDELFAGYSHFSKINKASKTCKKGVNNFLFDYIDKIGIKRISGRLEEKIKLLLGNDLQKMSLIRNYMNLNEAHEILHEHNNLYEYYSNDAKVMNIKTHFKEDLDIIDQISYYEIKNYLCDTLLHDSDVMSMHFGIELRPILLDHVLAEFIFSLPSNFKFDGIIHKKIFIDSVKDLLPNQIIDRPKLGFELPIWHWSNKITNSKVSSHWRNHILSHYFENK